MPSPILRIPCAFVRGNCSFQQVIARAHLAPQAWRFEMSPGEVRFARALLARHTELWLYRTDQQAFAGDFLLVDMSAPDPAMRQLWALDLKLGAPVRVGGGGAGNQLVCVDDAIDALYSLGVAAPRAESPPVLVTGDGDMLERWLPDTRRGMAA